MTTLTIKFQSSSDDFAVYVDDVQQTFSVTEDLISFETDISYGFHQLAISCNSPIKFLDVTVDGVSIKHTLYLSHCDNQLTTEITQGTWILPFGNPVSWWLSACAKKFSNGVYGTNLYDSYEIYYPESVCLKETYPKILRDFFKHNFGFHSHPKKIDPIHSTQVPYVNLNIKYNETALLAEFTKNLSLIEQHAYKPSQVDSTQPKPWQVAMVIYPGETTPSISNTDFPEFFKLLESIDGIDIGWAFIGALEPGSYVLPHVDDLYTYVDSVKDCVGCCQIYIPIGWGLGNYFKFNEVGLIPFDQGAILAGTTDFTHASVNDSDTIRYTIGIICKTMTKEFQKYIC